MKISIDSWAHHQLCYLFMKLQVIVDVTVICTLAVYFLRGPFYTFSHTDITTVKTIQVDQKCLIFVNKKWILCSN